MYGYANNKKHLYYINAEMIELSIDINQWMTGHVLNLFIGSCWRRFWQRDFV